MNNEPIEFPQTKIWDTQAETITFVNDGDFHKDALLEAMNLNSLDNDILSSLGAVDQGEIKRRQQGIRFFLDGKLNMLIEKLSYFNPKWILSLEMETTFLDFIQKKRDKFLDTLTLLKRMMTPRLREASYMDENHPIKACLRFFEDNRERYQAAKQRISERVVSELKRRYLYKGSLIIKSEHQSYEDARKHTVAESKVFGSIQHGFYLDPIFQFKVASFSEVCDIEKKWKRFFSIVFWILALPISVFPLALNAFLEKKRYTRLISNELPREIKKRIIHVIKENIEKHLEIDPSFDVSYEILFSFDEKGLFIRLVDYELETQITEAKKPKLWYSKRYRLFWIKDEMYDSNLTWYSRMKARQYSSFFKKVNEHANRRLYNLGVYSAFDQLLKDSDLVQGVTFDSTEFSEELRYTLASLLISFMRIQSFRKILILS